MEIKQYQIVLVNLDPTVGHEIKKTRPCLVISPDEMNRHLSTIVIAPITSSSKPYPTRIEIQQSQTKGWIVLDQIRTIDKRRVLQKFGDLKVPTVRKVKMALKETYVD
ncbi:MAG: type II toxin-antitoxin system PemK/MazF family toxin [Bacteroidota bacterium]|jgi:mRNA interferase MazF